MSKLPYKQRVQTAEAIHLPEDAAIQWLKENTYTEAPSAFLSDENKQQRDIVCFLYGRQRSPALNLAVAKYGAHRGTLRRLFKRGTQTERMAVLSNTLIGPNDPDRIFSNNNLILDELEATHVICNFNKSPGEAVALLSNPNIGRSWLTKTVIGWDKIEGIDGITFLNLIHTLSENPIISTPRDDTFMDGWAEHEYSRLNIALANLVNTAPVTTDWAYALQVLLNKLYLPFIPNELTGDLLTRWQPGNHDKDGAKRQFQYLREEIVSKLILRDHRPAAKDSLSISHDDKAVRMGLYKSLSPYDLFGSSVGQTGFSYPNARYWDTAELTDSQKEVVEVCKTCFARDHNEFIENLLWNTNFWERKEEREFLSNLCWSLADDPHSSMDMPNDFRAREQYYLKTRPDYFEDDEDADIPQEDTLEGRVERIADSIADLRKEFDELSINSLEDEQQKNFDRLIVQTERQFDAFSEELRSNAAELTERVSVSALIQKVQALEAKIGRQQVWYWIFLGLLVYLIIK